MFICIKDERTNICAINSASKMLLALLDHPLHHQLSLWGGFQPPLLLAPRLGKPKPVEMQGLNENGDNLNTMYVKEFIGSKHDDIYGAKSSI